MSKQKNVNSKPLDTSLIPLAHQARGTQEIRVKLLNIEIAVDSLLKRVEALEKAKK